MVSSPETIGQSKPDRILVVDADWSEARTIAAALADLGEVVCVPSGQDALRLLLTQSFALLLIDMGLRGLDGFEIGRIVRQFDASRETPILFIQGNPAEEVAHAEGLEGAPYAITPRPFDGKDVRARATALLEFAPDSKPKKPLGRPPELGAAERALREAEQRQALILKSLPLVFYVDDPDIRTRQFVGGDLFSLTGFADEAFRADPALWASRVHPDDQRLASDRVVGSAQGPDACEYRWLHADDVYRHFLDHGVAVAGEPGQKAGSILDVTERRQLEDRLMQAQRLDAIGQLTGGVAHDFNNLLAAVLSGLKLLERRIQPTEDTKQILEMTRHAATHGADLINRMLAFSRRQRLEPGVIRLAEFGDGLIGLTAPMLSGQVRLDWQVDASVWPAYADPSQLELALMNLIFNARDAMPGGGTISVSAVNRTVEHDTGDVRAGDYIVVSVSDTGAGIPTHLVAKVIEPFFTTKDVGKGTGLGLSTVYGFAKQSGGAFRIESAPGRGTSVHLWLPRARDDADDVWEATESAAGRNADGPTQVLLVEDSANLRELTARTLQDRGFTVVTAVGGAEAVSAIEREPQRFDLIVTDYAMPLVSGLDVVRFARGLRADWPAILVSGYTDAAGMADRPPDVPLLSKPFTDDHLVATMHRVLGISGPRQTYRT